MAPRAVTAEAATLAARQAVKEICDSPTARVGISADRASKFRCGIFRESSKKDIRHLSSSQGVAALLQMPAEMETPRLLNFGRAPTTLQAFVQPTSRRPMTPRKEAYSDVDSQVPMAAYLTEQPSTVRLPNYALLSSREGSLTRSASQRGVEVDVKPSMARRAAGASPRLRPVTPREGYSMLPAGRPSLGRRQIENMTGRRARIEHDGSVRARSEEPSSARSPSSASSRNPERHGRTWAELMVEAQELGALVNAPEARLRQEVAAGRQRAAAGQPCSPRRHMGAQLFRGEGWTYGEYKDESIEELLASFGIKASGRTKASVSTRMRH